jgi:hypothetical protein
MAGRTKMSLSRKSYILLADSLLKARKDFISEEAFQEFVVDLMWKLKGNNQNFNKDKWLEALK